MHAAEIVKSEPARDGGPVVFPLLAEGICEACEAAGAHARAQIAALDNARANAVRIGIAHDWDHLRAGYFGGRISRFAFCRGSVDFDELREGGAILKRVANR